MIVQKIVLIFVLFSYSLANASEFNDYLNREIEPVILSNVFQSPSSEHSWDMKRVRFRFQPKVGIVVPVLMKFEIVPEIELIWVKGTKNSSLLVKR